MSTACDAIVIGSGVGGLGAAALLAAQGRRVIVLERHSVAGGMTHTFRRRGFEWDVGLHYLGKVGDERDPLRCVFDAVTGGALAWAPMSSEGYDRLVIDGVRFDFPAGQGRLRAALLAAFPAERVAIDRYFALVARVARAAQPFFFERLLPRPLGGALSPLLGGPLRRLALRTTRETLDAVGASQRLAAVLAGRWGNEGLPPGECSFAMHALVTDCYLDGGYYPVGGAGRIVETMTPVIERAGGEVRVSTPVAAILCEGGRSAGIVLEGGGEIRAPYVISDVGAERTLDLLPPSPRAAATREALRPLASRIGHVALYLGLEGDAAELALRPSNTWVHAGDDHDASWAAFERDASAPLPLVYLSSPSSKDPAWPGARPGRSTVVAVAPAPLAHFDEWRDTRWRRRGPSYEAMKQAISARLLESVYQEMPATRGRVAYAELSTPLSTAHFSGRRDGAVYGLAHTPARFLTRELRPAFAARGLYLVGQDAVTVGVGASLMSSVLAVSLLTRRNVLADVRRRAAPPARARLLAPLGSEKLT